MSELSREFRASARWSEHDDSAQFHAFAPWKLLIRERGSNHNSAQAVRDERDLPGIVQVAQELAQTGRMFRDRLTGTRISHRGHGKTGVLEACSHRLHRRATAPQTVQQDD